MYGPHSEQDKAAFLDELRSIRQAHQDPWAVTGDLDDLLLKEVDLHGRRFTWSNKRTNPTLVWLDRFFCTIFWDDLFPNCILQAASSSMSDHCPIVLTTNLATPRHHRFKFENFWLKMDGYMQTVQEAWQPPHNMPPPLQKLDWLLSNTAKALQRWSQQLVGSVRSQLEMAKELVMRFDAAQEARPLSPLEQWSLQEI